MWRRKSARVIAAELEEAEDSVTRSLRPSVVLGTGAVGPSADVRLESAGNEGDLDDTDNHFASRHYSPGVDAGGSPIKRAGATTHNGRAFSQSRGSG